MTARAPVAGFLAGLAISILAITAEHSRIAFGSYALYGNGALVIPSILAPFVLYPGWVWILARSGDHRLDAALYTLGLHFGVGMTTVLDAVFFPASPASSLLGALPGLVFTGAIFVLPSALLAAATLWLLGSRRLPINVLSVFVAFLFATVLSYFFGIGLGILSGGAVALALRRPERRIAIGVALLIALVIVGNAPLAFLLFAAARAVITTA